MKKAWRKKLTTSDYWFAIFVAIGTSLLLGLLNTEENFQSGLKGHFIFIISMFFIQILGKYLFGYALVPLNKDSE